MELFSIVGTTALFLFNFSVSVNFFNQLFESFILAIKSKTEIIFLLKIDPIFS